MGLAAAVGGIEPEDRRRLAARAREPAAHVGEQVPEAPRGIGVGEETHRVEVSGARPAGDHGGEVGGEVGVGDRSREDVRPRPTGLEYRGNGHVACFTRLAGRASDGLSIWGSVLSGRGRPG